jgi:hypothetical protein
MFNPNELDDGTLIPSNLKVGGGIDINNLRQANYALRQGHVIAITYPDDPGSISKKYIEYDVLVAHGDQRTGVNISVYRSCKVSNIFGSQNNSLTMTLAPGQPAEDGKSTYVKGAIVLLLCIDGKPDAGNAVIIGGLTSPENSKDYKKDDGQFYDFNFNGINININKDGEYTIEFNSVLDNDGNKTNTAASGTKIKIDKEGGIKISDNESQSWELNRKDKKSVWTNGAESIIIDKASKSISMDSSGNISEKSSKDTSIEAGGKGSFKSKSDLELSSSANLKQESKGNMNVKSGGNWNVQIQGNAVIKAGTNAIIESGGVAQLKGNINIIGNGALPVAVAGLSICIGVGNLGAPVISNILTGSSTVLVGT